MSTYINPADLSSNHLKPSHRHSAALKTRSYSLTPVDTLIKVALKHMSRSPRLFRRSSKLTNSPNIVIWKTPSRRMAGAQFPGTRFGCLCDKAAGVRCGGVSIGGLCVSQGRRMICVLRCCIQHLPAMRDHTHDRQGFDQVVHGWTMGIHIYKHPDIWVSGCGEGDFGRRGYILKTSICAI